MNDTQVLQAQYVGADRAFVDELRSELARTNIRLKETATHSIQPSIPVVFDLADNLAKEQRLIAQLSLQFQGMPLIVVAEDVTPELAMGLQKQGVEALFDKSSLSLEPFIAAVVAANQKIASWQQAIAFVTKFQHESATPSATR